MLLAQFTLFTWLQLNLSLLVLQADTDLLSDRRARMDEWREWFEFKRSHREQMAAAAQKIISQRYPTLVDLPEDYTTEQVQNTLFSAL